MQISSFVFEFCKSVVVLEKMVQQVGIDVFLFYIDGMVVGCFLVSYGMIVGGVQYFKSQFVVIVKIQVGYFVKGSCKIQGVIVVGIFIDIGVGQFGYVYYVFGV